MRKRLLCLLAGWNIVTTTFCVAANLPPGATLIPNQRVNSDNGRYTLVMQTDGNLVYYRNSDWTPRWNSQTQGRGGYAPMQGDGNLVVYTSGGTPVWNSQTNGYPGAYLAAQDDGNLVIYQNGRALWNIGVDPALGDPLNAGDVVGRSLDVPLLGALGHIGVYDGSQVVEVLNEGGNVVRYNPLSNFKSRSSYWGTAAANIPAYNVNACYNDYCGPGSYQTTSSRVSMMRHAFQVYIIGADYTTTAQYTAATPRFPDRPARRGLYRCDTFVLDILSSTSLSPGTVTAPNGLPAANDAVISRWLVFLASTLRNTVLPTSIFGKLAAYR